jgi:hypothetical protein
LDVRFENVVKGVCVIDGKPLSGAHGWVCLKCNRLCKVYVAAPMAGRDIEIADVKSGCCGADAANFGSITCGRACHEALVHELEKEFGVTKKVVDVETGRAYAVPTRDLVERGLTRDQLVAYPPYGEGGVG